MSIKYVLSPPEVSSVAISGTDDRFPVRRIFCVGRNYAAHAREMGKDPDREPPFFFTKPADALCDSSTCVPYPPLTDNLHHEVELVVAIGRHASDLTLDNALGAVWGYGVGLDLTRRDLQLHARDLGRPWDWGKSFDFSAPCGPLRPAGTVSIDSAEIRLTVNGETHQHSTLTNLIWSIPEVVALCSQAVVLQPGDLIYSGTPEGVGPVVPGDRLVATVEGLDDLAITIG